MPAVGSAVGLCSVGQGGAQRTAKEGSRCLVCELQAGDGSLPYTATKRSLGSSERLEECTRLFTALVPEVVLRWREAGGNEKGKKENF